MTKLKTLTQQDAIKIAGIAECDPRTVIAIHSEPAKRKPSAVRRRVEAALKAGGFVAALLLALAPPLARAAEPACLWTTDDLQCPPAELTAEDVTYFEAKAEAALRLAGCAGGSGPCQVIPASLAFEPPEWALAPMPWLSYQPGDDPSNPWEE